MEIISSVGRVIGWQIIPLIVFLSIASYSDIKSYKIRNWTSGGLAISNSILFILIPFIQGDTDFAITSIWGGVAAFMLLFILAFITLAKMAGDIKLAGAVGIALGGIGSLTWLFISAVLAAIGALIKVKVTYKTTWLEAMQSPVLFKGIVGKLPMAPFFFAGFIVLVLSNLLIGGI